MLHSHVHAFIPFLPTNAPDPICGHCITLCLHINASCILLQDNSYLPKYWTEAANVETYFESTWARESIFMHGYLFQPHPSLHFVPNLSLVLLEAHSNWELAQQIIKAPPPRGCARLGCLLSTFLFRGWYMTTLLGCHPSPWIPLNALGNGMIKESVKTYLCIQMQQAQRVTLIFLLQTMMESLAIKFI